MKIRQNSLIDILLKLIWVVNFILVFTEFSITALGILFWGVNIIILCVTTYIINNYVH